MRVCLAALLTLIAVPAAAEDRELCADRPGLGTPACTIAPGKLQIETAIADWTREAAGSERTDTTAIGETLLRFGVAEQTELRAQWTPYGRVRDRVAGRTRRSGGVGDVTLGVRQNLINPDGSGFSAALQPSITLPTGGPAIGEGTWSASLIVPVDFELSDGVTLSLSPELDAAADEDRHGRHLAFGSVVGFAFDLSDAVTTSIELEALRDRDPRDHNTLALGALSVAWQPKGDMQIDAGVIAGLNHASPDIEIAIGVSRRF